MRVHAPESLVRETSPLRIEPERVAVFLFSQRPSSAECVAWCDTQLSSEERGRAERFVTRELREDYVVAHGMLRHLLSRYLGVPASSLDFANGPAGKPVLVARHTEAPPISFNLTHSGGLAALAVSDGRAIGIDLEAPDREIDALSIARNYFFGEEYDAIARASSETRTQVFLQYWVAKEAVLKGEGVGLGFPLDRFQIQIADAGRWASVTSHDVARLAPDWIVRHIPCENGWPVAVAARGTRWAVDVGR